ncbi:MAG: 4-hydroxy-3-methylbut-2-enyl diphosphate reductase [Bacteriovoracaceae bacterium]|nr:4-hydroxy-3-methylbut-2-enyl diphosphate reductase [Bacteriovoracaceae bacterium]
MKVTLADSLGTCFGVDDAIQEAMDPQFRGNLTIIGQLVHNPQTVQQLRDNGVEIVNSADDVITTPNVMITAHGAAKSVHEKAEAKGYKVYDATCPLVMKVHKSIARLVEEGYFPVVIGQASHVEVRGIVTDLKEFSVIYDENDFNKIIDKPKIGIVSQTTNQINTVRSIVEKIRALRNPDGSEKDVKFIDTVCKPTKDRQVAVEKLSSEVDLMIVIGGYNSSNTKKLKKVCDDKGLPAYHIEKSHELNAEWFRGIERVGITAGTSTPSYVIDQVYQAVVSMGEQLDAEKNGSPTSLPVSA